MVEMKSEYGGMEIERIVPFSRNGHEESVRVKIVCEGLPSSEQTSQITRIADEAKEKIKKIVEEW
jgi:hypothetical protein